MESFKTISVWRKSITSEDILNDLLEIDFAKDDKIDEWKHFLDMVENKPFWKKN